MPRKHKFLDLNRVDWAEVGDRIHEVLIIIKGDSMSFEEAATKRGVNLEQLAAAALTEMLRKHLETQTT